MFNSHVPKIYGISQDPNTKDYILIIEDIYCKICGDKYLNFSYQWCKSCQLSYLKNNFTNWSSGNENIDKLIQEMQLKINDYRDSVFKWIPYNQFNNIKTIGMGGFATIYSAMWTDNPLHIKKKHRNLRKIALKHLHNSQNITDEFVNEV